MVATRLSLAFAITTLVAAPQLRAQSGPVVLRGTITDSAGGKPLAGAVVSLAPIGRSARSDEDGHYVFAGLRRDTLVMTVRLVGYAPRTLAVDLGSGDRQVDVALVAGTIQLDSITVAASDPATEALHAEQATTVMTAEQVDRERGQTLGETIREMPGVAVIQFGPSIAKPVVRGLHSQRLRVMNGDIPQEGQQWGEEHAPEIDAFAANTIEVIRGSGFVLYGSDAIGGVVRVLPRPLPQIGRFGGEFDLNMFSNNRQGAGSLLLEGAGLKVPLLGPVGWRLQGSVRRAGDAATPDYRLVNTGFTEDNLNASVGVNRSWGNSILTYSRFSTDIGMYLGAHVATVTDLDRAMQDPLKSRDFSYSIKRPNQHVSHDLVSWQTNLALGHSALLDVNYGFQYNYRAEYDGIGFASGSTRPAFGLNLYTHTLDARLRLASVGRLRSTVGMSGMRQGNLSPGRSFLIPQYRIYTGGVYTLEQLDFGRLTVSGGLRYDYHWQHAFQYGNPVIISPEERRSWAGLSGSAGANYQFAPGWSIATTASRGWRAPNVSERFSAGVHHGTAQYQLGDSSITEEQSVVMDATLRHVGQQVQLELSAYRNQMDGFIYLRPFGDVSTVRGAYPGYQFSQTDALLRGVEASAQFTPGTHWSAYSSATVVRGHDRATGDPLFDMPADRLIGNVRYTGGTHRRLIAPYLEVGTNLVRKQDQLPSNTVYKLPTAGYALFNIEAGAASLNALGQPVEMSLSVRNMFNTRYRDYLSRYRLFVDDAGRDVVLRVTMPFGRTRSH